MQNKLRQTAWKSGSEKAVHADAADPGATANRAVKQDKADSPLSLAAEQPAKSETVLGFTALHFHC